MIHHFLDLYQPIVIRKRFHYPSPIKFFSNNFVSQALRIHDFSFETRLLLIGKTDNIHSSIQLLNLHWRINYYTIKIRKRNSNSLTMTRLYIFLGREREKKFFQDFGWVS